MGRDNLSIEGLRAILFLCIFLFHAWGHMFPLGWAGINTFLVITAYFLTKKYLQKPPEEVHIREVLKKRAIRLYPPYLTVIFFMTILFFATTRQIPGDFFSYFLFAQNFQAEFVPASTQVPYVGHFWYLTLDFYLVFIWLFVLKYVPRRNIIIIFIILLLVTVGYRSICSFYSESITMPYILPWGMMDAFAAGGILACIPEMRELKGIPWLAITLGAMGFAFCIYTTTERFDVSFLSALGHYRTAKGYADSPITVNIHLAMASLSFFVVWLCTSNRKMYKFLSNKHLLKMGG